MTTVPPTGQGPAPDPTRPTPPADTASAADPTDRVDLAGVRMVSVRLQGEDYGPFSGAIVETPVDAKASETETVEAQQRLHSNMKMLIKAGRIRYNPPGYEMQTPDYFDQKRNPYIGFTVYRDGQMYIERVKIATNG